VIRVLLVIPTLDRAGAEKQLTLLATRLPEELFEVRVVTLTRNGPYEEEIANAGIPVTCLHKHWKLDPVTCGRLKKVIREFKPDIVHSWMFTANSYVRAVTPKSNRSCRTVVSERCVDLWKGAGRKWIDRRLISRTDCLLANSEPVAEFYRKSGYPAEKIEVIPNGVELPAVPDDQTVKETRDKLLESYGFEPDFNVVVSIGRLAPQKRVHDIVWSFQLLKQNKPRSCLFVVGDGPEKEKLEELAKQFATDELVRFVGHQEDVQPFLESADVFWNASEYEGMSNSLMEAMAAGVPVVVSDIEPNRVLVEDGEDGFVVPVGDCPAFTQFSLKILDEPELAQRLSHACRERMSEQFSLSKMVQSHVELYQRLVGK